MVPWLFEVLRKGTLTTRYPRGPVPGTGPFRGYLRVNAGKPCADCRLCAAACPPAALGVEAGALTVDHARCLRCGACVTACPEGGLALSSSPLGATTSRAALLENSLRPQRREARADVPAERRPLRLSLALRTVDTGSCGACESELQALANPYYDLTRLGLSFTPTPKHADALLVTGPVTPGMAGPLTEAHNALPEPRLVIAVGACATGGGVFPISAFSHGGLDRVLNPSVYVPGCPPHPLAILEGILLALGRAKSTLPQEVAG